MRVSAVEVVFCGVGMYKVKKMLYNQRVFVL